MRGRWFPAALLACACGASSGASHDPGSGGATSTGGAVANASGGNVAIASGGSVATAAGGRAPGEAGGAGRGTGGFYTTTPVVDSGTNTPARDGGSPDSGAGGCMGNDCFTPAVPLPGTPGTWKDPGSGLTWAQPPASGSVAAAKAYCGDLVLGGRDDFRLPSIDELRTLVRGCPDSMTGGACGITASCTDISTCFGGCGGCPDAQGPAGGCYWDPAVSPVSCLSYWSSTQKDVSPEANWDLDFSSANVLWMWSSQAVWFMCVRGP